MDPASPPASPAIDWCALVPDDQWAIYHRVIEAAQKRGIRFVIGGGLAFSHYANRCRNTKDMDLYVAPAEREAMIEATRAAGLRDYYDEKPYDRKWIYRSHNGEGIIVDIIWQMANYRAQVDDDWLTRGDLVEIRGVSLRLLPAEELMWAKLYILQRDRCDWGDLLNILYNRAATLDWKHFLQRIGNDKPVLAALLEVFSWACPEKAHELVPGEVWRTLGITPAQIPHAPEVDREHIRMLDSRDWFGPTSPLAPASPPVPTPAS
ncbi:MAG TPA: nucleotidyltransferase [Phycisphaerae bacterium]|nr:nucleotidyltransferase [Phycisphaerae bacterium]